jgi:biotin carboxylase
MGKTLLILSGAAEAIDVARRTQEMGHMLVVCDGDPHAPVFGFADSCLIADVQGATESAAAAERYNRKIRKIDGVLCLVDAALSAATVAGRLRLPGVALHVAELIADRMRMKRALQSGGIATNWYAQIFTPQELQRAVIARGRDLILRPVEQGCSFGAQRLGGVEDLAGAFQKAHAASPSQCVMVEEIGQPVRMPAFMLAGRCFMAEPQMRELVERAASWLGISDGPVIAEISGSDATALLVELSPRLSTTGEFLRAAIDWATGENLSANDLIP